MKPVHTRITFDLTFIDHQTIELDKAIFQALGIEWVDDANSPKGSVVLVDEIATEVWDTVRPHLKPALLKALLAYKAKVVDESRPEHINVQMTKASDAELRARAAIARAEAAEERARRAEAAAAELEAALPKAKAAKR